MPGIKLADIKLNRLSLAVLALLCSNPTVADDTLASIQILEWKGNTASGKVGSEPAVEASQVNTAADETAIEAGQSTTANESTVEASLDVEASEAIAEASPDDVWQRIRNGFGIDDGGTRNPLVSVHEAWFAARPENVLRLVERSRPYLFHIVEELGRRGMPMEIALLPMIESAFLPTALSPAAASGIWQFMPATGRHYGLKQDNWYDGRRDFTASTKAALNYLSKLYLEFGDWQLALAAYNCGEGCVARAIRKNVEQGLPTDYASLPLPNETRHYVPRLLAIRNVIYQPEHYGLAIGALPNRPYFNQVTVHASMDIHSAARLADMSSEEFVALNAAFPRKLIHSDTPVNLLVPVGKADTFQRNLETGSWDSWKPYPAKRGERPKAIAKRFGVSLARLEEHNLLQVKRGKLVRAQTILVPVKGRGVSGAEKPTLAASKATRHVVKRGDTLFGVARRYGLSVAQLTEANPKLGTALKAGQVIRIPSNESTAGRSDAIQPVSLKTDSKKSEQLTHYTVRRGDSLNVIAQRYDISLTDLKAWNPDFMKNSAIRPGQTVIVRKP